MSGQAIESALSRTARLEVSFMAEVASQIRNIPTKIDMNRCILQSGYHLAQPLLLRTRSGVPSHSTMLYLIDPSERDCLSWKACVR